MLEKLKSITLLILLTMLFYSIAWAQPVSKTANVAHLQSAANNTEQYKVTISKGDHITDAHVELLPNNDGEYWIPSGYSIKVNADCEDGYEQSTNDTYLIDQAKTVALESNTAPPTRLDELEQRVEALEQKDVYLEKEWKYLGYVNSSSSPKLNYDSSKYTELAILSYAGMERVYSQAPIIYPIKLLKDHCESPGNAAYANSVANNSSHTTTRFYISSTFVQATGGTINSNTNVGCDAYVYAR